MCGITGKIYFNPSRNVKMPELKKMVDSISHRGPDDEGFFIKDNVGLGFKRLSIIDLKNGHQPLSNNSKNIWITFNGEIYNYKIIRKTLENKGYSFNTDTDTEVIVNSYEEYGEECVLQFRGMFSFVIWDDRKKIIFGGRDRIGIKPFYYYVDNNQFIWGSEIKAIRASNIESSSLNYNAFDQYLAYGHTLKTDTFFKNIKKVEAGTTFTLSTTKRKKIKFKKYWKYDYKPDFSKNKNDFIEKLKYEIKNSVKIRMNSDVPIGAFLSGGFDSSVIVSLMSSLSKSKIKTFSIGFKEEKFNELENARSVAEKYDTDHNELIIEPESVDIISNLVSLYDEPFADASSIPTYLLSKLTSNQIKVSLSGDGGDELFAGYSSYGKMLKLHNRVLNYKLFNKFIYGVHKALPDFTELKKWSYYFGVDSNLIGAYLGIFKHYERCELYKNILSKEMLNFRAEECKIELLKNYDGDLIAKMQNLDFETYLVDDVLTKVDRSSMQHSLEVRVPLLDHKVVELAASIPTRFKIDGLNQKVIFKEAFSSLLPSNIVNQKKRGFTIPLSMWFKDDLKSYLGDTLLSPNSRLKTILHKDRIEMMVKNHNLGLRDYGTKIWTLIFLESWLESNKINL